MITNTLFSYDEPIYIYGKEFFTPDGSTTNRTTLFDTYSHADSEYSSFKNLENHLTKMLFNFSRKTKFIKKEKTLIFNHSSF